MLLFLWHIPITAVASDGLRLRELLGIATPAVERTAPWWTQNAIGGGCWMVDGGAKPDQSCNAADMYLVESWGKRQEIVSPLFAESETFSFCARSNFRTIPFHTLVTYSAYPHSLPLSHTLACHLWFQILGFAPSTYQCKQKKKKKKNTGKLTGRTCDVHIYTTMKAFKILGKMI